MALRRALRLALPALATASLLALTGCAGGSTASPSPSASSASSAPTPTVDTRPTPASASAPARNLAAPELPEAAKQNTAEGFEAFTRYWFDTITYALETGDEAPLKAISKPTCKMCAAFWDEAIADREAGRWGVGPRWTISGFVPDMTPDPLGQVQGLFTVAESPSSKHTDGGVTVSTSAGGEVGGNQVIYAQFVEGRWLAAEAGGA